jgi:hypothetical protein
MKRFHFYHAETGALHHSAIAINVPDLMVDACARKNCPPGHLPIEGEFDSLSQRVDVETKQVVAYQPPRPSSDHEWNADSKRWQLRADVTERQQRRVEALARISTLEAEQHRAVREILLKVAPDEAKRLSEIEAQIARLRKQLALQ